MVLSERKCAETGLVAVEDIRGIVTENNTPSENRLLQAAWNDFFVDKTFYHSDTFYLLQKIITLLTALPK